jgi:hypothetical protein
MTAPALTPAAAYAIASQWGSYQHAGDPGASFYAFRKDDGRPVSEEHRAQCLRYLDRECWVAAQLAIENARAWRDAARVASAERDLADLRRLKLWFRTAPLWTEAP